MNNRKVLGELVQKYDEADNACRLTSGDTLTYWEAQKEYAEEEISAIIDDNYSKIDCARHMIWSEAL